MLAHGIRANRVLDRRSLMIERGGHHGARFLDSIARRIQRAKVAHVEASIHPVRLGWTLRATHRAVIVRHRRHPDLRCYVGTRRLGVHLEVLRLTALEPGPLKACVAGLLHRGAWWVWSAPRGIRAEEDVRSFLTLIDGCVRDATRALAARLGKRRPLFSGARGDALDQWE